MIDDSRIVADHRRPSARGQRARAPRNRFRHGAAVKADRQRVPRVPKLESRRYWVWIRPEALRDLFLALGGAVAGDGKHSHSAVGGAGAP